jgi:hypothetical protein
MYTVIGLIDADGLQAPVRDYGGPGPARDPVGRTRPGSGSCYQPVVVPQPQPRLVRLAQRRRSRRRPGRRPGPRWLSLADAAGRHRRVGVGERAVRRGAEEEGDAVGGDGGGEAQQRRAVAAGGVAAGGEQQLPAPAMRRDGLAEVRQACARVRSLGTARQRRVGSRGVLWGLVGVVGAAGRRAVYWGGRGCRMGLHGATSAGLAD